MTQEQRDEILLSLASDINNIKSDIIELKEKEKILTSLVNDVKELKKDVAELKKDVAELKKDVAELKKESIRQRENLARLEFTLLDKIEALFNAREISSDKFEEHDKELKSINHILGNHNRRLVTLESRAN